MISKSVLSLEAFSPAVRRKFCLGSLQLLLIALFVVDTMRWLNRTATGTFWHFPPVHWFALLVLGLYSVLAARGITRIVRRMAGPE